MANAVYDPEDLKEKESRPRHLDDDGAEPLSAEEQASLDQMEAGLREDDTAQDADYSKDGKEKSDDIDKADQQESPSLYNDEGGDKQKKRRIRITKKQGIVGGSAAGLLIGGGFGIMSMISGPLQIVHFAQLLQGFHFGNNALFQDSRASRLIRYARTQNEPSRRNLGFISNQFADHYQRKLTNMGFELNFTDAASNQGRYIRSISVDPNTPQGRSLLGEIQANGVEIPSASDGRVIIDFDAADGAASRRALRGMTGQLKLNGISSAMSKRLLIRRAGVNFHPMTNLRRQANQSYVDFKQSVEDKFNETRRRGVSPPSTTDLAPETTTDNDGNVLEDASSREAANGGNEAVGASRADLEEGRSNVRGKLAARGAAGIGVLCMVRSIGQQAEYLQYANIVLPLMRVGMDVVTMGNQTMANAATLDELGVISDALYDDAEGTSWASARSIQAEQGQSLTGPDLPPVASPANVGDKPAIVAFIDEIPGIGSACSTVGQIFMSALGGVTSFVIDQAVNLASSATGVDPMGMLADWLARKMAGEEIDAAAEGALLGNYANYGARLAANDAAISVGGNALSNTDVAVLDGERIAIEKAEFRQKNLATRLFDPYEPGSLLASTLLQNSSFASTASMAGGLLKLPLNLFGVFSSSSSVLLPKALAQDIAPNEEYDYGFPEFGFTQSEMDDPRVADPYTNAQVIEGRLDELNQRYGNCFSTTINSNGSVVTGDSKRYDEIGDHCRDGSEDLLRYRFYLADVVTAKSLSCYEGLDEAACTELGFGPQVTSTQPGSLNVPGLNGYAVPCTGQPAQVIRRNEGSNGPSAVWTGIQDSGTIGNNSAGQPIKVYIREACDTTNVKTIVILGSIHGSENGGQFVAHELLFNAQLPPNVRIIAIPELLPESSIAARNRRNANGVDLNRNFDYRWSQSGDSDEVTPGGTFYRGTAPNSEPETVAIMNFLQALGNVSLLLTYHDNLNYVAPVGTTPFALANAYAAASGMHGQCAENPSNNNCAMKTVNQSGSLDGWYHHTTGHPTILVEMASDQTPAAINRHIDAIRAVAGGSL